MNEKHNCYELVFKYLWVLIIVPKAFQFVLFSIYLIYILKQEKWKIKADYFAYPIFIYALINILSIVINMIGTSISSRFFAAINTAIIWIVANGLSCVFLEAKVDLQKIGRYCFINNVILVSSLLVARIMFEVGKNDMVLPILGNTLYWQEEKYSRFNAFMEYPTLIVPFALMMLPGSLIYLKQKLRNKFNIKTTYSLLCVYYLVSCLPVYFCYSRMGYILMIMGFAGIVLLKIREELSKKEWIILLLILAVGLFIIPILFKQQCQELLDKLLNMRVYSNSTRMTIYKESVEAFWTSPIIGCGIKNYSSTGLPLGSHSSYIGFLYKTGILGTIFVLSGLLLKFINLIQYIRGNNKVVQLYSIFLLLMFIFAVTEDLDGADWLICVFFILLGLTGSMNKKEKGTTDKILIEENSVK